MKYFWLQCERSSIMCIAAKQIRNKIFEKKSFKASNSSWYFSSLFKSWWMATCRTNGVPVMFIFFFWNSSASSAACITARMIFKIMSQEYSAELGIQNFIQSENVWYTVCSSKWQRKHLSSLVWLVRSLNTMNITEMNGNIIEITMAFLQNRLILVKPLLGTSIIFNTSMIWYNVLIFLCTIISLIKCVPTWTALIKLSYFNWWFGIKRYWVGELHNICWKEYCK